MLGLLSKIKIIDNTGVLIGRCIKILRPNKLDCATIGDIIQISVLKTLPKSKFVKGSILKILIVRCKYLLFSDNAGLIINEKLLPIGNRIKGPMLMKLNKNIKLITLAAPYTVI